MNPHIPAYLTRLSIGVIAVTCDLLSTRIILESSSAFYETRPWGNNPYLYFLTVLVAINVIFLAEIFNGKWVIKIDDRIVINQHTLSLFYAFLPFYGAIYNIMFFFYAR